MDKSDPKSYTTEQLIEFRDKGRKKIHALEIGNLADMRVHSQYGGGDSVLDRNFANIQALRAMLAKVVGELKERGVIG